MAVIFDIETGPLDEAVLRERMPEFDESAVKCGNIKDPEKIAAKIAAAREDHERAWFDRAALNAATGRVLAIGVSEGVLGGFFGSNDESKIIHQFWKLAGGSYRGGNRLIGFNIHNFDLPFLVRRSWLLGVTVPDWILDRGRYWHPTFVDLLEVWRLGSRNEYISQNELAKVTGAQGKPDGITGADFARLWNEDREAAIAYLRNDIEMIVGIAEALQVV